MDEMAHSEIKEIIYPQEGLLIKESTLMPVFCKPKLIPLKSITLERLEQLQEDTIYKNKALVDEKRLESRGGPTEKPESTPADNSSSPAEPGSTDIWTAG